LLGKITLRRTAMANDYEVRSMNDGDPAIEIDPSTVKCGLCMLPSSLSHWLQQSEGEVKIPSTGLHDTLRHQFGSFWDEVLRLNPQLIIHHMVASDENTVRAFSFLREFGPLKGLNVGLLKCEIDRGDGSKSDLFYGFAWEDRQNDKLQLVLLNLGRVEPPRVRKDAKGRRAWWEFWRSRK
jgi:hypothetical protein